MSIAGCWAVNMSPLERVQELNVAVVDAHQASALEAANIEWISPLTGTGPAHDAAVQQLHELMLRAARHQISRMYMSLPEIGAVRWDEIIHQAADEATVAALGKLATFEGRSRFTTWAYKFGVLHATVEVRRNMWRHREVPLEQLPDPVSAGGSPEQYVEGTEFVNAVSEALDDVLTAHQRRVVVALLVDNVPVDVLGDRLSSTRNALYKTLHDARRQLRAHLSAIGLLAATASQEVE